MRMLMRAGLAATCGLLALAFAGSAFAAISPRLVVTATNVVGGPNVTIDAGVQNVADDAIHKLQIFVPTGFDINAPASGVVGTASSHVVVTDVDASRDEQFKGNVTAISPTDAAVSWENQNCDGGPHAAAWMVNLSGYSKLSFPIFVNRTSGAEAAFGPYKLVMCLRSPGLPNSSTFRPEFGAKMRRVLLTLKGFKVPTAPGDYRWRSLWTPYGSPPPGVTHSTTTPNPAGNIEAQSIIRLPMGTVTISAKKIKQVVKGKVQSRVLITGGLTVSGEAPGYRAKVGFTHGVAKNRLTGLGSTTATNAGKFSIRAMLKKPQYFQAGVTLKAQELGGGGCIPSFGTTVPCYGATIGANRVLSNLVHLRP
jgi:hypothetical protein